MNGQSAGENRDRRERMVSLARQFSRFLVVGLFSFSIDFGLFAVLYNVLGVQYLVASTVSFSISLVINYILTLRFVFVAKPGRNVSVEFAIYIALNMVALGLNQAILFFTVEALGIAPLIGKLIATAVVLIYNFVSRKILIERARGGARPPMVNNEDGPPMRSGSGE